MGRRAMGPLDNPLGAAAQDTCPYERSRRRSGHLSTRQSRRRKRKRTAGAMLPRALTVCFFVQKIHMFFRTKTYVFCIAFLFFFISEGITFRSLSRGCLDPTEGPRACTTDRPTGHVAHGASLRRLAGRCRCASTPRVHDRACMASRRNASPRTGSTN